MDSYPVPWPSLAVILALGVALFAFGGTNWIAVLAVTAAAFGRYSRSPAPAVIGATACGVAGLTVSVVNGYQSGVILAAGLIAPLAGLFAYSAGRRADTLDMLRRTRAEPTRTGRPERSPSSSRWPGNRWPTFVRRSPGSVSQTSLASS
jgi:hypothetical protein